MKKVLIFQKNDYLPKTKCVWFFSFHRISSAICCAAVLQTIQMVDRYYALAHKPLPDFKFRINYPSTTLLPNIRIDWMWLRSNYVSLLGLLTRYLNRSWAKSSSRNSTKAGYTNVWHNFCVMAWRQDCSQFTPFHHLSSQGENCALIGSGFFSTNRRFQVIIDMHHIYGNIHLSLCQYKSPNILHRYRNVNIYFFATKFWLSKLCVRAWSHFWRR